MFIASLYNLKGGVGKTASCVNFAYMAARDGLKVLLWDLDPQGAASFYYNITPKGKGSAKKLVENVSIDEAIMATGYDNLDIIPADISARKLDMLLNNNDASKKFIKNLLKNSDNQYDLVLFDCGPGFSILADNVFYASDAVLMPVIPTTLSVRAYEAVRTHFEEKDEVDKLMCFFTMVDTRKNMHTETMQHLLQDKRFFEYYIPTLSDVEKMGANQAPLEAFAPSSYANTCYRALWKEIKQKLLSK